jgi:MYXO-CTERM domain-containing protein
VTDDLVGSLSLDLAAQSETSALIVADVDIDSDPATAEDREIVAFERSGNGWSPTRRLTDNQLPDAFPQAAYLSDGSPVLAWLQGVTLVGLEGDLGGEPSAWDVAPDGSLGVDLTAGQVLAGPDGSLDLVWPGFTPQGLGVWRARRPSRNAAWEEAQAVVDGTDGIGLLSGAIDASGRLSVGYSALEFAGEAPTAVDLLVTSPSAAPSETGDAGGPSGFQCLGLTAPLALAFVLRGRRRRPASPEVDGP